MTVSRIHVILFLTMCLALAGQPARANLPSRFAFDNVDEFDKGELANVSLSSFGNLRLAPSIEFVRSAAPTAPSTGMDEQVIWSILAAKEDVFAGTGNGGLILTRHGTEPSKVLARTGELLVTGLVQDEHGVLFAGTVPNGRIFRVENGKAELYCQLPSPYIWALALAGDGRLLAATGPDGNLYAIGSDKKPQRLLHTTERNLSALIVGSDKAIYVGTEPSGLVYKLTPDGKAFAVYDAPQQEIRALALDHAGNLYAAATTAQRTMPPTPAQPAAAPAGGSGGDQKGGRSKSRDTETGSNQTGSNKASTEAPTQVSELALPTSEGQTQANPEEKPKEPEAKPASRSTTPSKFGKKGTDANQAVYRITPAGAVTQVFSAAAAAVLCLGVDASDRVYVGTGNQGLIYRIDPDQQVVKLARLETGQVMAMASLPNGTLCLGTGNPAQLVLLGPGMASSGQWTSDPHDFGGLTRWGRLGFSLEGSTVNTVVVSTRTGNSAKPDETWSPWSSPLNHPTGEPITSPPARFLQVRVDLSTPNPATTPVLTEVWLIQQGANQAPEIGSFSVGQPEVDTVSDLRDLEQRDTQKDKENKRKKKEPSSLRHLKWEATDPNNDRLSFRLAIRGEGETEWRDLMGRDLTGTALEWDASDLADGWYRLRLTVSDRQSNAVDAALADQDVSDPFLVDNTPPQVELAGESYPAGGSVEISGKASDSASSVLNIEYAVDNGDYQIISTADGMADSPHEEFKFRVTGLSPGEHGLVVRSHDELGNAGTARKVIHIK